MKPILFNLAEARLDLYPLLAGSVSRTRPFGMMDDENPIILGACAEGLSIGQEFSEYNYTPTGQQHSRTRHIGEQHVITMRRLWLADGTEDEAEVFTINKNQLLFLQITWIEDAPAEKVADAELHWLRRVYHGATTPGLKLSDRDIFEFESNQEFRAPFYIQTAGKGAPPAAGGGS